MKLLCRYLCLFGSRFNQNQYAALLDVYRQHKGAETFIANYEAPDITAVVLSQHSANVWSISPPDRTRLIYELNSSKIQTNPLRISVLFCLILANPITVRLEYQISHKSNTKEDPGVLRGLVEVTMEAFVKGQPNPERKKLYDMLLTSKGASPVSLPNLLPKFLKVTNRGTVSTISTLMSPDPGE